jgi:hypothetical protein
MVSVMTNLSVSFPRVWQRGQKYGTMKVMNMDEADDMREEYDFSKGERGKFHIPANKIRLPVYLAPDVELRLRKQAEKMGKTPSELAAVILDNELRIIESLSAR